MSGAQMTVYLVILHDRHSDDQIAVFSSWPGAQLDVWKTIESYNGQYQWRRDKAPGNWADLWVVDHWDGPWIHVEKHEVNP